MLGCEKLQPLCQSVSFDVSRHGRMFVDCGLSLSLCVKITIPVLRVLSQIEAELRASSLAGSDCGLKTPSPLSSLTSHTQSSHRHFAPL